MRRINPWLCLVVLVGGTLMAGCGPSRANIELRRQNQALRAELLEARRAREHLRAEIQRLEAQDQIERVPTLPQERLDRLFVTHEIYVGRLTSGVDLDPETEGDDGLRIYIVPRDRAAGLLKAAGSFTFEAFDLNRSQHPLIGRWAFTTEEAAEHWLGRALMYGYVFTLPWQEIVPVSEVLTVRATFVEELTGRAFHAQTEVRIDPPRRRPAE